MYELAIHGFNAQELVIHGIYRHFKGDHYIVEGIATHSETREDLVLYRGLYGECTAKLYARPKSMFLERIPKEKCLPGLEQEYRFQLQHIPSVAPR